MNRIQTKYVKVTKVVIVHLTHICMKVYKTNFAIKKNIGIPDLVDNKKKKNCIRKLHCLIITRHSDKGC